MVETEDEADCAAHLANLIPHPTDAHEADGAKIFSHLSRIDVQNGPQLRAGNGVDVPSGGELPQVSVIPDQPLEDYWSQGLQLTSCRPWMLPTSEAFVISITF
jgi:hypothetical protein